MIAVKEGQPYAAELLLELGADLHDNDGIGRSPLDMAVLMERAEIVQLLLEAGAPVTQRCSEWWGPRCKSDTVRNLLSAELMRRGQEHVCRDLEARHLTFLLNDCDFEPAKPETGRTEAQAKDGPTETRAKVADLENGTSGAKVLAMGSAAATGG